MKREIAFAIFLMLVFYACYAFAAQNETMFVEANILAESIPQDLISIEVPDYIFLGDVNEHDSSDKAKIYVNNTGTVDVTITPQLADPNDEIFQNLYFQNRQTGNNSRVYQIGQYSFDILKPSSAGGKRSEYFYMWLDLTDYPDDITEDLLGQKTEIVFIALPQG